MPTIMVTLKANASHDELDKAKKHVVEQGGKIIHEYKLTKGFSAELPADKVSVLESSPHLDVEEDQAVSTQ